MRVIKTAASVAVVTAAFAAGWVVGHLGPAAGAQAAQVPPQHFKCYSTSGRAPTGAFALDDQFRRWLPAERFQVGPPRLVCAPVVKRVIAAAPGFRPGQTGTHLKFYAIGGNPPRLPRDPTFSNQFGEEANKISEVQLLCVPSAKHL